MNHPGATTAQIAAILTEMIDAQRHSGEQGIARDQPIHCRLGTYELHGNASFKVANPRQRSVWACTLRRLDHAQELGPVILKTVFRKAQPGAVRGPPREAKFYAGPGRQAGLVDFRIPKLYAINIQDDGSIQLFIEQIDDLREASSRTELYRAAEAMGRFAGHCHLAKLYEVDWLPRGTIMPQFHQMTSFESLIAWLPLGTEEKSEVLGSYQQLLTRIADFDQAYEAEIPTLCHGDLNRRNLLLHGQGFAAIDWETVNSGRLGDDLGRLALRMLREKEPDGGPDDEQFLSAYAAGVAPFLSRTPMEAIRRVFRLRLFIEAIGEIDTHWRWMRNARDGATRRQRMNILAQAYRRMAQRARVAIRELDG